MAVQADDRQLGGRYLELVGNSVTLAAVTALLAVALGTLMAYGRRLQGTPVVQLANRLAAMGYATPGTIIAVGVLVPFAAFDNALDAWLRANLGVSTGLLLTGSIAALVFAYLVRFLAVSLNTVEAGLAKIRPSMDDAARALGARPLGMLARVHVPLMRSEEHTSELQSLLRTSYAAFCFKQQNTTQPHSYLIRSILIHIN